jgi:hypothetical protein
MRSSTIARAARKGRQVSDSPALRALARAGLVARGIVYVLLGWVAILVAFGHQTGQANQQGALELLAGKPFGLVLLWLLGFGLVAYALWRLSEAAFGATGEPDPRSAGARLKSLGGAAVYTFLAYLTFQVIAGAHTSQSGRQQDETAHAMHYPAGRWLVGIAGLIVVIIGAALVIRGIRREFLRYLQTARMSPKARAVVRVLGVIGSIARGTVVALAGIGVIEAAVTYQPSKSRGLDQALLMLRNQPFGEILVLLAALGLLTFGVYSLCEARWRKV